MGELGPLDDRAAVLLSGGVDSSVLTRLAVLQGYGGTTFGASFPFEDPARDMEARYASSAADALHVQHQHHLPTIQRYLRAVVEAIDATEVPLHGLQTALLSSLYRDVVPPTVRVIVIGDGADTVFGNSILKTVHEVGEPWRLESLVSQRPILEALWRSGTGVGCRLADRLAVRRPFLYEIEDPRHQIWSEQRFGDVRWTCNHFGVQVESCSASRREVLARYAQSPVIDRFLLLNLLGNNDALQTMWARLAQATGRAAYYPYTHPEVIRSATTIPWDARVPDTKYQLRQAARRLGVPDLVLTRPKAYFGISCERWAGRDGVLEPLVRLAAPVVGEETIRQVQGGTEPRARIYWNLLNYGIWHRLFINGDSVGSLLGELDAADDSAPTGILVEQR